MAERFDTNVCFETWRGRIVKIRTSLSRVVRNTRHNQTLEDKHIKFFEFIEMPYPYTPPKPQWRAKYNPDKILVLSDLHEPYVNEQLLKSMEREHRDAAHVHINGDFGDYYSKSHFRKTKHGNFNEEVRAVFLRMAWLSARWRKVTITLGNHDDRPLKALATLVTTDQLWMTETDLMVYMSRFFDNVEIVGTKIPGKDGELAWLWQLGDIVFTHVERSFEDESRVLKVISQQLHLWNSVFKLKPYRVIAQGHNHVACQVCRGNEVLYLLPFGGDIGGMGFDYAFGPRLVGKPPVPGYAIFYQHNGVTDTNESRIFTL